MDPNLDTPFCQLNTQFRSEPTRCSGNQFGFNMKMTQNALKMAPPSSCGHPFTGRRSRSAVFVLIAALIDIPATCLEIGFRVTRAPFWLLSSVATIALKKIQRGVKYNSEDH